MVENAPSGLTLGEHLSARRAQVSPESVGVTSLGQRRVPGLRREEVATLAGVSVDYYIRLEQGRERSPSAQVLDALARALRLDDDGRWHLYRLAGLVPTSRDDARETVDPELLRLLEMWPDNPAIVLGRAYDVLAGNALAYALFSGFASGPNLMSKVFLDPGARTFYPDWEQVARYTVAGFRLQQGTYPDDPRFAELIAELSAGSPEFRELWALHEARGKRLDAKRFHHADVGALQLRMNAFDVRSAPGQELIVYHADEGSPSAEALALLGSLAATRDLDDETSPAR